jgi:hypothetical protein
MSVKNSSILIAYYTYSQCSFLPLFVYKHNKRLIIIFVYFLLVSFNPSPILLRKLQIFNKLLHIRFLFYYNLFIKIGDGLISLFVRNIIFIDCSESKTLYPTPIFTPARCKYGLTLTMCITRLKNTHILRLDKTIIFTTI